MTPGNGTRIDYGLLQRFTTQLLCSRCLRLGRKTLVAQVVSHRHRLLSLCPDCREERRREPAAS